MMELQQEPLPLLSLTSDSHNYSNGHGHNNHPKSLPNSDSESQDSFQNGTGGGHHHQTNQTNGQQMNGHQQQHQTLQQQQQQQQNDQTNRFNSYLNRGSELWTHWTWLGGQGKMSLMRCNYCLVNKQLKNAPKCRRHLIKCPKTPESVRKFFERKELEASRVSAFMREIRSKEGKFVRNSNIQKSTNQQSPQQQPQKTTQPIVATTTPLVINRSASARIVPKPSANDLKHLNYKTNGGSDNRFTNGGVLQHANKKQQTVVSNGHNGNGHNNTDNHDVAAFIDKIQSKHDIIDKLMQYSPIVNRSLKVIEKNNHNHQQQQQQQQQFSSIKIMNGRISNNNSNNSSPSNTNNEQIMMNGGGQINYNLLYQLMSMTSTTTTTPSSTTPPLNSNVLTPSLNEQQSIISNDNHQNRYPILSGKLKRKQQQFNDYHLNKENEQKKLAPPSPPPNGGNTVVINLDDLSSVITTTTNGVAMNRRNIDCIDTGDNDQPYANGPGKKIKMDPGHTIDDGSVITGHDDDSTMINAKDLNLIKDELNDLLLSAFISEGIDLKLVNNLYFDKFIRQLIRYSSSLMVANQLRYRLPSIDQLISNNTLNLIRKFDYETTKIFSECDSIVISIDEMIPPSSKEDVNSNTQSTNMDHREQKLNINLMIQSSTNESIHLFYKSIVYGVWNDQQSQSTPPPSSLREVEDIEIDTKSLNNQIDSIINKIGPDRIDAIILPFDHRYSKCSSLLQSYLSTLHSHIVPLTNIFKLFSNLFNDLLRLPALNRLLMKSFDLFEYLVTISDENLQNHWQKVLDDDQRGQRFITQNKDCPSMRSISVNLMFTWLVSARTDIMELLLENNDGEKRPKLIENADFDAKFFDQIECFNNFLSPIVNSLHSIASNESMVISDIVRIYFDVKNSTISNMNDMKRLVFDTEEEQEDMGPWKTLELLLNEYLNDKNLSKYYYLAYYLDPRFRNDDKCYNLEQNEELIAEIYDALYLYAKSLGCVNNTTDNDNDNDRELLIDSLDEFRNGNKLYGMQLLKYSFRSPSKFWKHLRRFPSTAKLAYCASRLLSISTRSMVIGQSFNQNNDNKSINSIYEHLINDKIDKQENQMIDSTDFSIIMEKLQPIQSYLRSNSHSETMESNVINGHNGIGHNGLNNTNGECSDGHNGDCHNGNVDLNSDEHLVGNDNHHKSTINISNKIKNVINLILKQKNYFITNIIAQQQQVPSSD